MIDPGRSQINDSNPLEGLNEVFRLLLGETNTNNKPEDYNPLIPYPLRQLYALYYNYAESGFVKDLFRTQDALLLPAELDLSESPIAFVIENQGNWNIFVKAENGIYEIYCNDFEGEYLEIPRKISVSLEEVLVTFALQELMFSLEEISCGYRWSVDVLPQKFSSVVPVWVGKKYNDDNPSHDFYLLDNDILCGVICGTVFLFTTNPEKAESLNL